MPYAVLTKGSREHNFTVGFSYNFADEFNNTSNLSEEKFVLNLADIQQIYYKEIIHIRLVNYYLGNLI